MKGLPGVVGAIDGSHIKINPPKQNKQTYYNRKKYYSVLLQGILLFVLMSKKTRAAYDRLFFNIRKLALEHGTVLNPERIICDFEKAIIS